MWENIVLEKEGNIAVLSINRPRALNALNTKTLLELDEALESVSKDGEVRALVVTGSGDRAFVAGADINEMKDKNAMEGREFALLGQRVFAKLQDMPIPTIAAINGYALGGGCELALACDMRIASSKAKIGQPEVTLGITPGFAGTQRLARTVGPAIAKELIFTGAQISADEAYRIGLVNRVVEPEKLMEEAKNLALKIASNAPIAVSLAKQAINKGIDVDLSTGMAYEAEVFGLCFSTRDQKEGMAAFVEKRKAEFKNE
ncbi:short-chain-enoyl-CoA hydratase [Calorimonas adulescens]|jgi:Enoyl-CoA hydratase/isomerase family.|uniref:short-chain-enoyl-CoA hydratase n=1 Tax=Calorimonas adulescens TaxID=2606906 RepID=A0A5D8QF43_9THEO|nr:short-chain-enoyl-CoA hydratase [Calorimonas adulescens]TZE82804.1 short-chain-enoyl-CoA hydratase [Calorimonas adulescens]